MGNVVVGRWATFLEMFRSLTSTVCNCAHRQPIQNEEERQIGPTGAKKFKYMHLQLRVVQVVHNHFLGFCDSPSLSNQS